MGLRPIPPLAARQAGRVLRPFGPPPLPALLAAYGTRSARQAAVLARSHRSACARKRAKCVALGCGLRSDT